MRRNANGWHVELENARTGHVFRPRVVGKPERLPKLNGLPRIEIPVPRDEKWLDEDFEEAPMRVWFDGEKQPIEELERVEVREDTTILHGIGAEQLKDRVTVEYDTKEIHTAAEDLINTHTSYTPNVDVPQSDTTENVQFASADTTTDLDKHFTPDATSPLVVKNGKLQVSQTCFVLGDEDPIWTTQRINTAASGDWEGTYGDNNCTSINENASVGEDWQMSFTLDHDVPASDFVIWTRNATAGHFYNGNGYTYPGFRVDLNGNTVVTFANDYQDVEHKWEWDQFGTAADAGYTTLPAGNHTITFVVEQAGDSTKHDEWGFDMVVAEDSRFTHNFDNDNGNPYGTDTSNNSPAWLDGPELYPQGEEIVSDGHSSTKAITGGRIETTVPETSNEYRLGISNDGGSSFLTKSNAATYEDDFVDAGTEIRWKVRLGRYGTRTELTPKQGFEGHAVDAFTLYADESTIPIISDRNYDDSLRSILRDFADKGDMLFEYRDDGTTQSIEMTSHGQRQSSKTPDISTYSVEKTSSGVYEKVVVYGAAVEAQKEAFTANHGVAVSLANADLVPASEVVYSGNTVYTRGDDYAMNYRDGTITTKSSGAMTDGNTYRIDYRWKLSGTATAKGVSSPNRTLVKRIPAITTARTAEQAASILVANTSTPQYEGEVVIPNDEAGWSVIEDIQFPAVPTGGQRVQIKDVESTPKQTVVRFGNRESVADIISDIRERVSAVSSRV